MGGLPAEADAIKLLDLKSVQEKNQQLSVPGAEEVILPPPLCLTLKMSVLYATYFSDFQENKLFVKCFKMLIITSF